jgi:hypothetical protein
MKFKINQVCFDSENKEFVKITNGIPVEENDSLGINGREVVPTEALALRVISLNQGKPVLGYTYRKVNPAKLSIAEDGGQLEAILTTEKPKHYEFMGRV